MREKKLIIVSNRLPVSIVQENGAPVIKPSSGGLVSAMNSFLELKHEDVGKEFSEILWVGSPGCRVEEWQNLKKQLQGGPFTYAPVFIDDKTYRGYYDGFSNSTIWPLFHYFPSYTEFNPDDFNSYIRANKAFSDVVIENTNKSDVVWVHDYHLFLLPKMIREKIPEITLGFFLHIPFPSYEIFRLLPKEWSCMVLEGMLGADIAGFHTNDYVMYFMQSVQRILGYEDDLRIINYKNRLVKADIFPISVDYSRFNGAFDKEEIIKGRNELRKNFGNNKIIFSVDRLDYTKGIEYRLSAFKEFLINNPDFKGKVVFILIIVPSRDSIDKYSERKKMIDELVGQLNGKFGTMEWTPLIYRYSNLDFNELLTLYTGCNLALLTPIRDGMNLVAKEFVASRKDKQGVLILSEMAGAANELGESIIINPTDKEDMAAKIRLALDMPAPEQEARMANMQKRIESYDVSAWAIDFLEQLKEIKIRQKKFAVLFLSAWQKLKLAFHFTKSRRRLLLLDYNGTLVGFTPNPELALPPANVIRTLEKLSSSNRNNIYIISGRNSEALEDWFGHLPINLAAEHGAKTKLRGHEWQNNISNSIEWKKKGIEIMQSYVRRCANSIVEVKDFSVAWHYRKSEKDLGELRAKELYNELNDVFKNANVQVLNGNKVIELRSLETDKGVLVRKIVSEKDYDFILAAGDDRTDEDMFKALAQNENAWTIKIGLHISSARYNLESPVSLIRLLNMLG